MERANRVGNRVVFTTVVGAGIALAEVVGLNLSVIRTNPLPVDLFEAIIISFDT